MTCKDVLDDAHPITLRVHHVCLCVWLGVCQLCIVLLLSFLLKSIPRNESSKIISDRDWINLLLVFLKIVESLIP
jgi:hypothetical protein